MTEQQGPAVKTLKDIKSLFEFGDEIAPFLEELFAFLTDLMPILAKANHLLGDTTASMPAASENIASANTIAESATHTIMDHVDEITVGLDDLISSQKEQKAKAELEKLAGKLGEIQTALQFQDITSQHLSQATQIVAAIQVRMEKMFESLQSIGKKNEAVKAILESYAGEITSDVALTAEDTIRRDEAISQDEIDALFGN